MSASAFSCASCRPAGRCPHLDGRRPRPLACTTTFTPSARRSWFSTATTWLGRRVAGRGAGWLASAAVPCTAGVAVAGSKTALPSRAAPRRCVPTAGSSMTSSSSAAGGFSTWSTRHPRLRRRLWRSGNASPGCCSRTVWSKAAEGRRQAVSPASMTRRSTSSQTRCQASRWTSWIRGVLSDGANRQASQSRASSRPSLPVKPIVVAPRSRAAASAQDLRRPAARADADDAIAGGHMSTHWAGENLGELVVVADRRENRGVTGQRDGG